MTVEGKSLHETKPTLKLNVLGLAFFSAIEAGVSITHIFLRLWEFNPILMKGQVFLYAVLISLQVS